ncbi:MAG: DUF4093 domain-containing protein [Clostridia bacterium]|nr:DUF4093 domain-containing protein [Clostridia bacterium]
MIKLDKAIIVEGKYDKIRLSNFIDATIITTDGFGIFKNEEKRSLIRLLAEKTGIVIITDSDHAGQVIRSHIKSFVSHGEIINVYLPLLCGKEKRKAKSSAEGLLGVEGTPDSIIIEALDRAHLIHENKDKTGKKISKTDLFTLGLSGGEKSSFLRDSLCKYLKIPTLPANTLLDALNTLFTYEEFLEMINRWKLEETEN